MTPWVLAALSVAAGAAGIAAATSRYRRRVPDEASGGWLLLGSGYRVDDAYAALFVSGGGAAAAWTAATLDQRGIDGAVNGVARITGMVAERLRPLQSGLVRWYGAVVLLGSVGLIAWFLTRGGL